MKANKQASDQPKWSIHDYTCEQLADWVEKMAAQEIALTPFQQKLVNQYGNSHSLECLRELKGMPASQRLGLFEIAKRLKHLLTLPRARFKIGGGRPKGVRYSEKLRQLGKMHGHTVHRYGSTAFILAEEEKS